VERSISGTANMQFRWNLYEESSARYFQMQSEREWTFYVFKIWFGMEKFK